MKLYHLLMNCNKNGTVRIRWAIYPNGMKPCIMYSKERLVVSKKEFADILPKRMEISPVMELKIIDIQVNGDSAIAKTSGSPNKRDTIKLNMKLVRDNGKWYLMSWDY